MQRELDLDMSIRMMILTKHQMICIPADHGLTGAAFTKGKTIYYNDFVSEASVNFYAQCDNPKSFKNITSFMMAPLIGHDGRPNGVI